MRKIFACLALIIMAMTICSGAKAEDAIELEHHLISVVDTMQIGSEFIAEGVEAECDRGQQPSAHYLSHHPRWQSFALPAGLGLGSALFATNGWLRQRRNDLQTWLDTSHQKKEIDNYIQYYPAVGVYLLKACGVRSEHNVLHQTGLLALSAATMAIIVNGVKYTVKELRPDGSRHNSFPSGHTATAFMGAEILFQEYRDVSPWIGYSGYFVAGLTGCLRIYNNRHWLNDVVAGACVGIISTKFAYWLYPRLFNVKDCQDSAVAAICPTIENGGCSLTLALKF